MSEPRHIVFLTTDFRPMVGGVADHLHRMADHLAARTPVTVMTTVPLEGASWPHAYRLVSLDPLPDRQLGRLPGDNVPPLRKLRTGAHFLALRRYADRVLAGIKAQQGDDVAVVIGIWDTASHFWCDACHRAGVPYYIVAHGVELLMELYRPAAAMEAARFLALGPCHRQQPRHRDAWRQIRLHWPLRRPSSTLRSVHVQPPTISPRGPPICDESSGSMRKRGADPADRREAGSTQGLRSGASKCRRACSGVPGASVHRRR